MGRAPRTAALASLVMVVAVVLAIPLAMVLVQGAVGRRHHADFLLALALAYLASVSLVLRRRRR